MQVTPLGDRALLIELDQRIDLEINSQVIALHKRLSGLSHDAILWCTPAFCSLGIGYDPSMISYADLVSLVQQQFDLVEDTAEHQPAVVRIPVCYSASCGIDLEHVAATTGLSIKQIVQLHSAKTYHAFMLGFLPGFAYLGSVDPSLQVNRQTEPRLKVAAGSVGLAGEQTGIYPCEAPGGWQIIGRTPVPLIGPDDASQFLISPGDQVQFYPIDEAEFDAMHLQHKTVEHGAQHSQPKEKIVTSSNRDSISLHFKTAGLRTSVQDFGRTGYQHFGIPSGGVMDRFSATIANRIVGNDDHASLIEITLMGPQIEFSGDCQIAITGANLTPQLDGQPIPMWETVSVKGEQRLSFGTRQTGCRCYLAIAGDFDEPRWLGSVSPAPPGANPTTDFRSLKGQTVSVAVAPQIKIKRSFPADQRPSCLTLERQGSLEYIVPMMPGPEWGWFSEHQQAAFLAHRFKILPNSNSMGYRLSSFLEGNVGSETVDSKPVDSEPDDFKQSMISSAVMPGVIQVTPNGQSILLMRDAQTTGGYPRIGVVCHTSLDEVAQLCPGDLIRFEFIESTD